MADVTDDLVAFLRARLDEDAAVAQDAADYDDGAQHDVQGPPGTWVLLSDDEFFGAAHLGGTIGPRIGHTNNVVLGAHIVRHDPARVLRQTAVLRNRLDLWSKMAGTHARTCLRDIAAIWDDHPDYRPEWRL